MQNVRLSLVSLGILASVAGAGSAMAADYEITVTNITGGAHFTPVLVTAHDPSAWIYRLATPASPELQAIAEGGDVSSMAALLDSIGASVATGDGLVAPSGSVTLSLTDVAPGSVFSMATMILPTNDGFAGVDSAPLPSTGSVTRFVRPYDAGTEANDEVVGSGAPGEPGFPNPPPVVATGTGVGASGINAKPEIYVHIHPGVIGDLDDAGGVSDINAAVHRWQNPVARVVITRTDGGDGGEGGGDGGEPTASGPSSVQSLTGTVYSQSALEIFWEPATSTDSSVQSYRVLRDGTSVATLDGLSYFEEGLNSGTPYSYSVSAIDANGDEGPAITVDLTTD